MAAISAQSQCNSLQKNKKIKTYGKAEKKICYFFNFLCSLATGCQSLSCFCHEIFEQGKCPLLPSPRPYVTELSPHSRQMAFYLDQMSDQGEGLPQTLCITQTCRQYITQYTGIRGKLQHPERSSNEDMLINRTFLSIYVMYMNVQIQVA